MSRLLALWRVRPWLTSAFLLACAVTVFFAASTAWNAAYWARHRDETIRPWMTVGYVARSWDLNPREIDAVAGLPLPQVKGRPQPLSEIAADRGVPVEEIIAKVEAAIVALRAEEDRQRAARKAGEPSGTGDGASGGSGAP